MGAEPFHFDLVSAPWVPVRLHDGGVRELGLLDTLLEAHDIIGLNVEFPTQEPPLLRLLLALCYRALRGPVDDAAWDSLWDAPTLPEAALTEYLERWRGRFDLFSPDAPFYQSPHLEPAGQGGIKPVTRLISHAPSANSVPLFTPMTDEMGLTLSPAEAARWLIERHAWGTSSDKTGAKGNPRLKSGKDSPQVGYVAWIGFTAPIGRSLRETLLLNLIPWNHASLLRGGPDDLPAWERPPTGPAREERPPDGVCDLYTWQGRRILLFPERRGDLDVVSSVLVCAGDNVPHDAVRSVDPQTGWRTKKERDGTLTYSPLKARTGQQVWRGLGALLALDEVHQRAGVLSWLAGLGERIEYVSLLVTSMTFGDMSSTVKDLLSDRLDTPVAVLRAENPVSFTVASDAVLLAEAAAKALGRVVEGPLLKLDEATGRYKVPEGKTDQAAAARRAIGEDLFAALDGPFRDFLSTLGDESDVSGARRRWSMVVGEYARAIARRTVVTWSAADVFTGALAEGWFQHDLARARDEFSPSDHEAKEVG